MPVLADERLMFLAFEFFVQFGGLSPTPPALQGKLVLVNNYGNGRHMVTYPVADDKYSWAQVSFFDRFFVSRVVSDIFILGLLQHHYPGSGDQRRLENPKRRTTGQNPRRTRSLCLGVRSRRLGKDRPEDRKGQFRSLNKSFDSLKMMFLVRSLRPTRTQVMV